MANMCSNQLVIKGLRSELMKFDAAFKKCVDGTENYRLNNLYPTPKKLLEKNDYIEIGDWRESHWGTRSEIDDPSMSVVVNELESIRYSFETRWSPIVEWVIAVSGKIHDITFYLDYHEPGMQFAGSLVCYNGRVLVDLYYEGSDYDRWVSEEFDE